jgi:hypothetical protein
MMRGDVHLVRLNPTPSRDTIAEVLGGLQEMFAE